MKASTTNTDTTKLIWQPLTELQQLLRSREISSVELTTAYLDQIDQVNPEINVIVAQLPREEILRLAKSADQAIQRGDDIGPLHGLPTAVKDLTHVSGLPTRYGCLAFRDVPATSHDSLIAKRLRDAGAILMGKTATAEFGVGTLTFSALEGITRNPYDPARHAGGSSGSAAAVAAGMLPFADGSDSGGSLRYPAAFCNTVGVRTSAGRIPNDGAGSGWSPHSVLGPMTRNSRDALVFLSAVSGESALSPISLATPAPHLSRALEIDLSTVRIAWSDDAGGLPIDPKIRAAHAQMKQRLIDLGCCVVDAELDYQGIDETWEIIEMFGFFSKGWREIEGRESLFRDDYVRNVRQGEQTNAKQLAMALEHRTHFYRRTATFMQNFDVYITPATPTLAPKAELEWPASIDGEEYDRYFEWQRLATRLTMTSHPIAVTPTGIIVDGMPVGMQVMGQARGEHRLLSITAAIEEALQTTVLRPELTFASCDTSH